MVNKKKLYDYIRTLDKSSTHEEKLYLMTKGVIELFPANEVYLFRYSPLGYIAEGIIRIHSSDLFYIGHIRDDVRNLSPIYDAIRKKQSVYISKNEFFKKYGCKYVNQNDKNDHIIVPVRFHSIVVGYFIIREFSNDVTFDESLLTSCTIYGELVGEVMESNKEGQTIDCLSKRETEVMQRISWGESTKEMADLMEISEFTVKDYIKSAIKKLQAKNRVHAVAELIRRGLIS